MTELTEKKMTCGIVMPISSIDGCSESHWSEVLEIITDAVEHSGFEANLVSNADEVGIIHKRIIQNLHDNPVVICDVSGKNPNVMFELGMRLAFDKPTIIIKDNQTPFTFDTSSIEHLEYPRDLRFTKIIEFKEKLTSKIKATYSKATSDPEYTTFLKHFGEFTVAKLDKKEVTGQEFILDELKSMRQSINRMERTSIKSERTWRRARTEKDELNICLEQYRPTETELTESLVLINNFNGISYAFATDVGRHKHLIIKISPEHEEEISMIESKVHNLLKNTRKINNEPAD
ncbi:hypothetical protein [Pseudomonas capsici]|uniref:hypothetical protein n=1 Tax=Pseudomonas capsici TaxID=2810614 RepID=UPI0021F20C7B|nr:hypothetical protein [Pseudomonas capsici]MCV4264493.1 hypothetical protein [Pseudomonas capsici]